MKHTTALKQSTASIKFLSGSIVVMALLAIKWPNRFTLITLAVLVASWVLDVYNVYRIRQRTARDPRSPDRSF
jgi:hypothetical protein